MKIMSKSDKRKCFEREINLFENIIIELKKTVDPYEKPPQSETRSNQNEEAFMKVSELEGNSMIPNDPDVLYEENKVVEQEEPQGNILNTISKKKKKSFYNYLK